MLNRLRYSSSSAFLRFILCAVISLTVFVGNSITSHASALHTYTNIGSYTIPELSRTYSFNIGADNKVTFGNGTVSDTMWNADSYILSFDTGVIHSTNVTFPTTYDYVEFIFYPFVYNSCAVSQYGAAISSLEYTVIQRPYIIVGGNKYYYSAANWNQIPITQYHSNMNINFGFEVDVVLSPDAVKSTTAGSSSDLLYTIDITLQQGTTGLQTTGVNYVSTGENGIMAILNNVVTTITNQTSSILSKFSDLFTAMTSNKTQILNEIGAVADAIANSDTIVVEQIQDQTNQQNQNAQAQIEATEKQNTLQESANELQEEANETSKGIFDKITDFFNGFFENISNTTSGLLVPEDGYFEDFFQRMNDFFAEKLGALYAPIDMFITIMNGILNADDIQPGIPFPGVKWEDTYIIEPTTVSFDTFYEQFPDLKEKIYFATDVILVGSVVWLLQVKLKEVMMN